MFVPSIVNTMMDGQNRVTLVSDYMIPLCLPTVNLGGGEI